MFKFNDIMYDDKNYYLFMLEKAFDLITEKTDFLELYDYNDKIIGRITIYDVMFILVDDNLIIIKDADIFDYKVDIPFFTPPTAKVDLNQIHYIKFPERFYQ